MPHTFRNKRTGDFASPKSAAEEKKLVDDPNWRQVADDSDDDKEPAKK